MSGKKDIKSVIAGVNAVLTAGAGPNPLACPQGRAWLAAELSRSEREVRIGPGGEGWQHNEGKRAEITARAAFLRAVIALLS